MGEDDVGEDDVGEDDVGEDDVTATVNCTVLEASSTARILSCPR